VIQVKQIEPHVDPSSAPPADRKLLTIAALLLAAPVVALLWVGTYARVEPTFAGFPFFIWYQFVWVFLCAVCTWGAYRLVLIARPRRSKWTRGGHRKETGR
jgi:membrane protein implicated in regulation of membrane protease activity